MTMNAESASAYGDGIFSPVRLQRLDRSVYGLIFVGLVISLDAPAIWSGFETSPRVPFLIERLAEVVIVAIVFLSMSWYWYLDCREARHIVRLDNRYVWCKLLQLGCVVIIPYPAILTVYYHGEQAILVFFSFTYFLVGFFAFLAWDYAYTGGRLVDRELPRRKQSRLRWEKLVEPARPWFRWPRCCIRISGVSPFS